MLYMKRAAETMDTNTMHIMVGTKRIRVGLLINLMEYPGVRVHRAPCPSHSAGICNDINIHLT